MSPRLPTEILAQILSLAQEGQHPLDRRATRWTFKHVCRDWYFSQDELIEICIKGVDQVDRMTDVLKTSAGPGAGSPLGLRVKSAYFGLFERKGKNKAGKVAELLELIPEVERIEFEVGKKGLAEVSVLGDAVCNALGKLNHVKHFATTRVDAYGPHIRQDMSLGQIMKFVPNWPALESFVIEAGLRGQDADNSSSVFASHFNLKHIAVQEVSLLVNLPTNVKSIVVSDYTAYQTNPLLTGDDFPTKLQNAIGAKAPELTQLSLWGDLGDRRVAGRRGHHEHLISSLREVRRLVIPAFAVANLATALAGLDRLVELEVMSGDFDNSSARAIRADEVVQLILDAPSLRRLALPRVTVRKWTDEGREAVKAAAEQKGVKLIDAGGWHA